jgi:hypothetical protein
MHPVRCPESEALDDSHSLISKSAPLRRHGWALTHPWLRATGRRDASKRHEDIPVSPAARGALERFLLAKQRLDAMLADADDGSGARGADASRKCTVEQ